MTTYFLECNKETTPGVRWIYRINDFFLIIDKSFLKAECEMCLVENKAFCHVTRSKSVYSETSVRLRVLVLVNMNTTASQPVPTISIWGPWANITDHSLKIGVPRKRRHISVTKNSVFF